MTAQPTAVFGATGNQGRATIDALLDKGTPVRALVRDPDSDKAAELAGRGVELRQVSLDDADGLRDAFAGASAAFVMATFTGPDGIEGELRTGTAVSSAAADADVPFVVYSSVGGAERNTGIPHFESKRAIEQHIESLGAHTTFLRPVFFMDNFATVAEPAREDGTIVVRMAMPGDIALQLIDVADLGAAAAALLLDPAGAPTAIEVGTDELTGEEIAAAFGERFGGDARYETLPLVQLDDDQQAMFAWFAGPNAYQADFAATRNLVPGARTFRDWLADADISL